jgi:hypothetical protein
MHIAAEAFGSTGGQHRVQTIHAPQASMPCLGVEPGLW